MGQCDTAPGDHWWEVVFNLQGSEIAFGEGLVEHKFFNLD